MSQASIENERRDDLREYAPADGARGARGEAVSSSVEAGASDYADTVEYTRAHTENFSVLSALLPGDLVNDFSAVYSFCRAADDLADETGNDEAARRKSLELLGEFREKVIDAGDGRADDPLFSALSRTMRRHRLPVQLFLDLIGAFELDQVRTRHETWESVIEYSRGSANPVGRLVLMMSGYRPPEEAPENTARFLMSDAICTALQLTNFWQDVRRDLIERDRVYIPLAETGLTVEALREWMKAPPEGVALERYTNAIRGLVDRTWGLYAQGRGLASTLRSDIAPVIRLFAAGGEEIQRRIERIGYRTLWERPRVGKAGKAWLVIKEMARKLLPSAAPIEHDAAQPRVSKPFFRDDDDAVQTRQPVLVVGGGVAGIAAAVRLSGMGVPVVLFESKRRLGGRATSFVDQGSGDTLDNCQHIALGCCEAYLDLCTRLGVMDQFDWHREQYWLEEGGRESIIRPGRLPAPGHYSEAFLAASFLNVSDKLAIGRAMTAIALADREAQVERTFGEYLAGLNQTERAIERFWEPIVVSACNLSVGRVSAGPALKVFQDGFLKGGQAGLIGVPRVPLVRLYDAAIELIRSAGGRVEFGANVERIWENRVLLDGREIRGSGVICALPVEKAARVVAAECQDSRFDAMRSAAFSPIVGVHLEFDRPVLMRPHAVLVGRGTQWLFRKDAAGSRMHAVISGADEWAELSEEAILGRVAEDVAACMPWARGAKVVWGRAVKERRATFAATPAFEKRRPRAAGEDGAGLILAGDYTNTDWPATMEGAARSGYEAACRLLKRLATSSTS